jgi:hypothetical protein
MKIIYTIVGLTTGGAEIMLYRILSKINRERFSSCCGLFDGSWDVGRSH